jgi:hypothetical protein
MHSELLRKDQTQAMNAAVEEPMSLQNLGTRDTNPELITDHWPPATDHRAYAHDASRAAEARL